MPWSCSSKRKSKRRSAKSQTITSASGPICPDAANRPSLDTVSAVIGAECPRKNTWLWGSAGSSITARTGRHNQSAHANPPRAASLTAYPRKPLRRKPDAHSLRHLHHRELRRRIQWHAPAPVPAWSSSVDECNGRFKKWRPPDSAVFRGDPLRVSRQRRVCVCVVDRTLRGRRDSRVTRRRSPTRLPTS